MLLSFATYAQEQTSYREKIQYEDAKSDIDGSMMEIVHFKDNDNYYRINKETGEVWQLKGEKIYALDVENSPNNTVYKGKINFQLIAGQDCACFGGIGAGIRLPCAHDRRAQER